MTTTHVLTSGNRENQKSQRFCLNLTQVITQERKPLQFVIVVRIIIAQRHTRQSPTEANDAIAHTRFTRFETTNNFVKLYAHKASCCHHHHSIEAISNITVHGVFVVIIIEQSTTIYLSRIKTTHHHPHYMSGECVQFPFQNLMLVA